MILHHKRLAITRDDPAVNRFYSSIPDAQIPWFDKLHGVGDYDRPFFGRVVARGLELARHESAPVGAMIVCSLMSIGYRDTLFEQRLFTLQSHHASAVFDPESGKVTTIGKWIITRKNEALAARVVRKPGGQIWMPDSLIQTDDTAEKRMTGLTVAYGEVVECGDECPEFAPGTLIQYDESANTVEFSRRDDQFIAVNYSQVVYSFSPEFLRDLGAPVSTPEELERWNKYAELRESAA